MDTIQIVLETITRYELSHNKLVLFLLGSRSQIIRGHAHLAGFGGLFWLRKSLVEHVITQLLTQEYIAQKRVTTPYGAYLVYILTLKGESVLSQKQLVRMPPYKAKAVLTQTIKKTLVLALSHIPLDRIAQLRGLTLHTIASHVAELILNGDLSVQNYVSRSDYVTISTYLDKHIYTSLKQLKVIFPDVSYVHLQLLYADFERRTEFAVT